MIFLFRSERSIDDENRAVRLLGVFSYLCTCNFFIYKLVPSESRDYEPSPVRICDTARDKDLHGRRVTYCNFFFFF